MVREYSKLSIRCEMLIKTDVSLPVMLSKINEKTLYVFTISNVITIPMVRALYPESNQHTLEEMNFLFAAKTPWVWVAERNFVRLKEEYPEIAHAAHKGEMVRDLETGKVGEGSLSASSVVKGAGLEAGP
jgi:hypothetical protein